MAGKCNHDPRFSGVFGTNNGCLACELESEADRATAAEARIARLTAQRDAALAMLRELEWLIPAQMTMACPSCRRLRPYGHASDCKLDALLKEEL